MVNMGGVHTNILGSDRGEMQKVFTSCVMDETTIWMVICWIVRGGGHILAGFGSFFTVDIWSIESYYIQTNGIVPRHQTEHHICRVNWCIGFYIQFRQCFAKETFSYDEHLKS